MSLWSDPDLRKLFLDETPLIDVRAPVEYAAGKIPFSVNLPLLIDDERHQIGICYKEQGQDAAIALGHQLVTGSVKEARIKAWTQYIDNHPRAEVFCFRGGLRSQISCEWITESGHPRKPIPGGYKRLRQFFLSLLDEAQLPTLTRLGGFTGSRKTALLQTLPNHIDLEELANHRGSAFGSRGEQPSQITFENDVALHLLRNPNHLIVEDESATLGRLRVPKRLYEAMLTSPLVFLRVDLEERVSNIFQDYVVPLDRDFFTGAVAKISRHFGGVRIQSLIQEMNDAFDHGKDLARHAPWIATLLTDYYDPYYQKAPTNQKTLVTFEGNRTQVSEF